MHQHVKKQTKQKFCAHFCYGISLRKCLNEQVCVRFLVQDLHKHTCIFIAPFAKQRPFPRKNYLPFLWSGNEFVVTARMVVVLKIFPIMSKWEIKDIY